jgi:hypothetical protein
LKGRARQISPAHGTAAVPLAHLTVTRRGGAALALETENGCARPPVMDCGTEDPRAHKALAAASTVARIWGPSGRFDGQRVGRGHLVAEGDVVEVLS